MYGKLIILLAAAGFLSAQSDTTLSPNTTTTLTTAVASTTNTTSVSTTESTTGSTTESAAGSTTASTANATTAAQSTTQSAVEGTRPPEHHGHHGHPRPPGHHRNPKPPKPPGLHGSTNHVELPGLPIVSSFLNGFAKLFEPLVPSHTVGRHPRSTLSSNFSDSFNTTDMFDLFNGSSLPGFFGVPDLRNFHMPNVEDMVPSLLEMSNPQDLQIPEIPNFPRLPMIPGMRNAAKEARQRLADEISPGQDLVSGIQSAIQNGLSSSNPTEAMRGLVSAILDAYLSVARNCPFLIVGGYLMREGLWLSSVVLRTMADITEQIYNDS